MSGQERAILAWKDCGCLAGLVMEREPVARRWAGDWAVAGYRIETVSVEAARSVAKRCAEHPRADRMSQAVLL